MIRAEMGAGNFAAIERIVQLIGNYDTPAAGVTAMYDFITALPARLGSEFGSLFTNFNWNNLVDRLVAAAKDQLTNSVAQILPRLAAKFIPGIGVLTSIYDGIRFLINNAANLGTIFTTFVNSLGDLAASVTDPARLTGFTSAIVNIVQNQGLDLMLNFATSQLGLGNLRQNVRNVVSFIPTQVDTLMRRVVSTIAERITAALPGGGANGLLAGLVGQVRTFNYQNQAYTLWAARPRNGVTQVKVARSNSLVAVLTSQMFNGADAVRNFNAITTAMNRVTGAANLREAPQNVATLTAAEQTTITDVMAGRCSALGCFAAGTKLWTPDGYRTIESILPGELVFTRDEFDPNAEIVARPVEEGFRRFAPLLHLHIGGQIIRATGEHPFYVYNKGWTKASALQAWDCVLTADAQWIAIEEVYDTGEWEVVYNLRVEEHHTYFVGDWDWGWCVWSHNTCDEISQYRVQQNLPIYRQNDSTTGTVAHIKINGSDFWGRNESLPGSLSAAAQIYWFGLLKDAGYLSHYSGVNSAGFLRHAEAQALINAYTSLGSMPESIELFSDRVTCNYACRPDLPHLFRFLGIKTVTVVWRNMQRSPLVWNDTTGWI